MSRGQQLQSASSGSASPPFTCAALTEKCEVSDVISEGGGEKLRLYILGLAFDLHPDHRDNTLAVMMMCHTLLLSLLIRVLCFQMSTAEPEVSLSYFSSPTRRNATQAGVKNAASQTSGGNSGTKKCSARVANKNGKTRLRPQLIIFYWCLIHRFFQLIIKSVKYPQRRDEPSWRKRSKSSHLREQNHWMFGLSELLSIN